MDRKILRVLMKNPDLPVVELAQRVNLTHTPCWRRVKRMEEQGIILGRALLVNADRVDLGVNVFAHIKLKHHDEKTLEAFETATLSADAIIECFSMTGESDYLLRIVVGSIGEYEEMLKKFLLHLPGVGAINSSFALKSVKITTALPV